ncbi:serine/threonine-protein phosphatase [Vallicoccus soli]|uniref:Serine/threonine-protein phosphatase n=1 Tax=Vallicoccus soli TaxID=2339232 RepID=A0A3A3YWF5_9ACTN|nr:serine/threonine-protein phosphatase [Vallicoccus soli]
MESAAARAHGGLLRRAHLCSPADFTTIAVEEARALGVDELVIYLADHVERTLVPMPGRHTADRQPLSVEGTLGGRAYSTSSVLEVGSGSPLQTRLWIPLLDGTHRLGVVEVGLRPALGEVSDALVEACERYVHLLAQVSVSKAAYGDIVEFVRRTRPLSVAGELQRAQLPPATFATDRLALAALLEPVEAGGGDGYDYAANGDTAHLAVLSAHGEGVAAATSTALALAAYRSGRRALLGLEETWSLVDGALTAAPRPVTAVLAELDLGSGQLRWLSAGHAAPSLLRGGRPVRAGDAPAGPPLGAGAGAVRAGEPAVVRWALEPGDRLLLHTPGLATATTPQGERLDRDALCRLVERYDAAQGPAETLRRLRHAVLGPGSALAGDATALLLEWRGGHERTLVPALPRRARQPVG